MMGILAPLADRSQNLASRLQQLGITPTLATNASQAQPMPWWLSLLMALAAWLAALLGMAGLALLVQEPRAGYAGVLLAGAGLALMRGNGAARVFPQQFGFALSLAGQTLVALALAFDWRSEHVLLAYALISLLVSLPASPIWHRCLCLLSAQACAWAWLLNMGWPMAWTPPLITALALLGWLSRPGWTGRPQARWLQAWLHSVSLLTAGALLLQVSMPDMNIWLDHWTPDALPWLYRWRPWSCAALWLATLAWLCHDAGSGWRLWQLPAAALAALAWVMPNVLLALALTLVLFRAGQRVWLGVLLLTSLLLIGAYYHEMTLSLMGKSLSLMVLGTGMLAAAWWLGKAPHRLAHSPGDLQ
ncbi:DUF4401 domain-containing protein [Corticibacter populi]|uniref:DUF4401 domain-containing protein n=1 Tax=Corticibacter populi TaxID=1550736 RepID=A0A3M6QSH4_9BURK|nr:DUF4401 domain-containing protein [Corticibacter populi]RMX05984.1 DUF4401 domain-containing protein [Corticibacter populi]RZS30685.1 uncharacterized protein DUF4401 [Corticibacter populi]